MAIKKKELYSSLWASCDKLRGGMDASQYKDYILTLLFVKYVTDKFKGVKYADITVPEGGSFDDLVKLKGDKNIGEGIDKVIAKLAEAGDNNLRGVIDNAHFNDEAKLGKGKEMVEKLTGLISIFQRPEFDFRTNKASGDDILGDAYEYLMRNFATESGKSKGQFYTPAEVSRILAKVIGIDRIAERDEGWSVYDPACGSGSLLIRAADEAPFDISIWGQEKEVTTAGLAKMNLVLHNKAAGEIKAGNTFSDPQYFEEHSDDEVLKRFDFAVANPPFSLKNWTDGLKDFGRFSGYGDCPPEKNGDFAWLLHILKSLKSTGKAAVILPHGVLFRGNAEATIRKAIIDKGYIKGIIGLPANLFYGTGIPACIIIIDKEDAAERQGIFMIDASHDYVKDGNKNRLRERDIYKIVTTFNQQITDDPKYARFVPMSEIKEKNEYNLNIPRYIDSSTPEDLQDIEAHLHGGIPAVDVDSMDAYWQQFPQLKEKLFSPLRPGYYQLNIPKDDVRNAIYTDGEFMQFAEQIEEAFQNWQNRVNDGLRSIAEDLEVKAYIVELSAALIAAFADAPLIDKHDVYEVLLSYWQETMADDVYLISVDGYGAARNIEYIKGEYTSGKKKGEERIIGWEGVLLPKALIEKVFFAAERRRITEAEVIAEETESQLEELIEEQSGEEGFFSDFVDEDKLDAKKLVARYKQLKKANVQDDEYEAIRRYIELSDRLSDQNKLLKELNLELETMVKEKYPALTDAEVLDLLVNRKWYASIFDGINSLAVSVSHQMAARVLELAERYEDTLPELDKAVNDLEARVKAHLERMGIEYAEQLEAQALLTGKIRLPGFSGEWVTYQISDICRLINGRAYAQNELLPSGKYRILRLGNLFTNEHWYYSDLELPERQYCTKGDLIYAWSASFGPHIWTGEKVIYHYHIWKVELTDMVCKEYMYHYLRADVQKLMNELQGGTMAHLTKEAMEKRVITIPPYDEQVAIAKILSDVDNGISVLEQKLAKYRRLKEGMMQQLLTGKIRLIESI